MPDQRRTANRYPHLSAEVRRVIETYAVRDLTNRVVLCNPRDVELRFYPLAGNPKWSGNNGKICYPDALTAQTAADAINRIPGTDPVQHYACPRGGHFHHVDAGRARRAAARIIHAIAQAAGQK